MELNFPTHRPTPEHRPSKVILTDVDDALVDWATPFVKWVKTQEKWKSVPERLRDCETIEEWLGCGYAETRELIHNFNNDPDIWPHFEPLPGSQEAIKRLVDAGYRFVAITACDADEWTYEGRWYNLKTAFGNAFDTLHCVGLGGSKYEYLDRYKPAYWIEDKWSHAVEGASLGHKSFLMSYAHTEKYQDPRITKVTSWIEIANAILDQATDTIISAERQESDNHFIYWK